MLSLTPTPAKVLENEADKHCQLVLRIIFSVVWLPIPVFGNSVRANIRITIAGDMRLDVLGCYSVGSNQA